MKSTFVSSFTPSLMAPETLEAIFVQRHELADDLVAAIRESAVTQKKHFHLLVGMRGIGKTHLITLIYHRIAKMDDLGDKLLIAWLREEEWGVSSFLDLLLRIFRALQTQYPVEYQKKLALQVEELYQLPLDAAEEKAAALLKEFVGERTLLLLMENLKDLFDGLDKKGQKQFRTYIEKNSFLTILATTPFIFEALEEQKYPFYGFFDIQDIEKLELYDAINLLKHIAIQEGDKELASFIESPTGKGRIEAIAKLAGGNPRVYVIFANFLTCKTLDELVEPFMQTLDELTPYYQSLMWSLSQQQRKILEFLVDRRHAVAVKEIAQRCFITQQTASSQLKDLRDKGFVVAETVGRESFYELREVLMRFCLEVKKHRGEAIRLIVDFLRLWYSRTELQQLLEWEKGEFKQEWGFDGFREGLSKRRVEQELRLEKHYFTYQKPLKPLPAYAVIEREYVKRALEAIASEEDPRVAACLEEYKEFRDKEDYVSALEYAKKLVRIRGDANDWLKQGYCLDKLKYYEEALESYDKAIEIDPNCVDAWHNQGCLLNNNLERYNEALASFDEAIKLDPNYASVWCNRGIVLGNLNHYEEALVSFDKAIALDPNDAHAWYNRGYVLDNLNRKEEELESLDKAIALDPNYSYAWYNRGNVLDNLNRKQEALESYDKAIALDPNFADAWSNRGCLLNNDLKQYEKALASYNKAIEIDPNDASIWANLGNVLNNLKRYEEALTSVDKAIEIDPNYAWGWSKQGHVLSDLKRYEEALESYEKAIALDPNFACDWFRRGNLLLNFNRKEEALESYDKAIALDPNFADAWRNRYLLLRKLKRYEEASVSFYKVAELDPKFAWVRRWLSSTPEDIESFSKTLASFDKVIELGSHTLNLFNRAIALLGLNHWDKSINTLEKSLRNIASDEEAVIDDAKVIICKLFNSKQDAHIWRSRIKTLITLYKKYQAISVLGQGLVFSIPDLMSEMVSDKAAETWLEVWRELVGDVSEFVIPLRLLNAAVRYKITKGDRRVLLELPIEERNLLQPLLETDTSGD